jgi:CHAT domain-containing protein
LAFSRSADLRGDIFFRPLPGTAQEAQAIQKPLTAYAHAAPLLFLGANATEANAKALRRPKVLVLSTHGFFLPEQPRDRDPRTGELKPNPHAENPLLRCGLALAGANQREKATSENDGIFTGLEIVATDLRATELVVLSACETGLGDVNNGEGVAGLRQCFQLAGAKSVVATLWKIPDAESAALMSDFFNILSAGQPKADALRQAQLEAIARLKKEGTAPHPFFWAAYTLTGEWK